MAISLLRETSKLSVQNLLRIRPNEIWVGALFLASRQSQSRNFFRLASQLGKKKKVINDLKMLPTYLRPNNLYRHFSSSLCSSTTGFLKWYLCKLETNPVITKSVSASLIYTSADITSQAIYGPCMNTIFFSYNAALRGENGHENLARLKRDLLPTLKNSIVYWPFCDFMTFMFVPVHLQPLVTSSLAYLWIIYLSYVASLNKVGSVERKEHAFAKRTSNHAILPSNLITDI